MAKWLVPEKDINAFLAYVKKNKGVDLSSYRKTFLARRLKARIDITEKSNIIEYVSLIKSDPEEWNRFLDHLSINVSAFFRDPKVFAVFGELCLPQLIAEACQNPNQAITVWSCGCSCGEETYSLAIMFSEALKRSKSRLSIKIWGTDRDDDALAKAREGIYTKKALANVSPAILGEYFIPLGEGQFKVKDELKQLTCFKNQNVLTDESFIHRADVIFFRNVRIYFDTLESKKILLNIAESLRKGGYLALGMVESLGASYNDIFEPVSIREKIFRKI